MNPLLHLLDALGRLPLARQLYVAFAAVLVMTAVVGGVAITALSHIEAHVDDLANKWLGGVGLLAEARAGVAESREFEIKHSRIADKSYHAEYEEKFAAAAKAATAALSAYGTLLTADDERVALAALNKSWTAYQAGAERVLGLGRVGKSTDATDISDGAAGMAFDEAFGMLHKMNQHALDAGKEAAVMTSTIHAQALRWVVGLITATLALGIVLAHAITRGLLRQLGGEPGVASSVARAVAEGDLTTAVHLRAGDTRSLMARLHSMQQGLAAAVTDVRRGSENVAAASAQIAHGNQDLSTRTEQQAAALQETAATMEELGSTVRNNADNARQANQLALGASAVAVKGGSVVGQVVETMKGITDSSRKIAHIISVIDGIAFQTNILALNAAVEAARAGEQGRGFAVVAGEVRSLAQRSAEAAMEIKVLISASVSRVEQGTVLVGEAGKTMDEIVGAIKRVSDIVGEISAASAEQSAGVAQVGEAVSKMDQATQQNAALVEQSAAAAESMKEQAHGLVQAVAVFKLGAGDADAAPSAVPALRRRSKPAQALAARVERRGPDRATNVSRLTRGAAPAAPVVARAGATATLPATGTDDWQSF